MNAEVSPSDDKETQNIFILGICVLLAWMAVIVVCVSPQLFRDLINRYICCCVDAERRRNEEKIKMAQVRMMTARKSIATNIAGKPSEIFIQQVLGRTTVVEEPFDDAKKPPPTEEEMHSLVPPSIS